MTKKNLKKEIKKCSCGEEEFLQVLPKFSRHQVFCVNCGNTGQAMSSIEEAINFWNKINRFEKVDKNKK